MWDENGNESLSYLRLLIPPQLPTRCAGEHGGHRIGSLNCALVTVVDYHSYLHPLLSWGWVRVKCDGRVSERAGENGLPTVGRCRSGEVEWWLLVVGGRGPRSTILQFLERRPGWWDETKDKQTQKKRKWKGRHNIGVAYLWQAVLIG